MKQLNYLDKWERRYIENLPDFDLVAWSDEEAFNRFSKYNLVYDKLIMGKHHTSLETCDLEKEMPTIYPVIIKPRVNLFGMSKGAYIASYPEEIEDFKGYISQELSTRSHYSTELVIKNGKIIDHLSFLCTKNFYGSFILFETVAKIDTFDFRMVCNKVEELLKGFTGPICVEHLGANIIDFHLRPGNQFFDICNGMMQQYPSLMKGTYSPTKFIKSYSFVYRTRYNSRIKINQIPNKINGISSIQLCFEHNQPLSDDIQDEFSYRYMVINGFDLKTIRDHGNNIRRNLSFERI